MSIVQVAKVAGVSHGTVSKVINNRPGVSSATIQSVHKAMEDIGYTPPPPARRRGPRTKSHQGIRTGNIGMLFIGEDAAMYTCSPQFDWGVYAQAMSIVGNALADHGLNMMLATVTDAGRLPPFILQNDVDGLILLGSSPKITPAVRTKLKRIPSVWIMSSYGGWGDHIMPDNETIGRQAAEYLLDHGHQQLAYLSPEAGNTIYNDRGNGFQRTATAAGVAPVMLAGESPAGSVKEQMSPLVDRLLELQPRPTGLFIPSDQAAVVVYRLLEQRGVKPERDITVVSCDNALPYLEMLHPRPATFDLQGKTIGQRAVDQLLWRIRNPQAGGRMRILIESLLIEPEEEDTSADMYPATNYVVDS